MKGERAVLDSACNDDVDCNIKIYFFIGYVNKLMVNNGRLQTNVLIYSSHIVVLFIIIIS